MINYLILSTKLPRQNTNHTQTQEFMWKNQREKTTRNTPNKNHNCKINYKIPNLSILCMSHRERKISLFFFLSHTIFLLDWVYYKTLFFLHYYAHCEFSFFFASLCNINQSLSYSHWFVCFTKFVVNNTQILLSLPLHYLLSKNLISRNSLVFHTKTTQK